MSIVIELPPAIEAALEADARAQGRDPASVVVERLSAWYAPEPPYVEEGSSEEIAAIEEALKGSFHPFDPEAAFEKMHGKHQRP